VRRSGSSVARSRSPLIESAPTTTPMNIPNEIVERTVRKTISAGGMRLTSLSTSRRTAVTDMSSA